MSILTDSLLETDTYYVRGWEAIYNSNIDRLNDLLLKINGLIDVTLEGDIKDGSVLTYQASNSTWRPHRYEES